MVSKKEPNKPFGFTLERKEKPLMRLGRTMDEILRASFKKAIIIPNPAVHDPYNAVQKQMFEDAFNADHTVKQAILRKAQFTLGRHTKLNLEVSQESLEPDEKEKLINDPIWLEHLEHIKEIDRSIKMHHNLKAMLIQSAVFGRSAVQIITGKRKFHDGLEANNVPIQLKILTSRFLGKVFVDTDTWKMTGVIYVMYNKTGNPIDNTLLPEEMIYFTRDDYHITPLTLYYGRSSIESIAHISEMNRRMDEVDFKEIVTQHWAGFLDVFINTRNQSIAKAIANNMDPGKVAFHNQDVKITPIEVPKDLAGLIALRDNNDHAILRGINVPSIIMNFENITNRATADDVLIAWQLSTLRDEQEWLRDTMQDQYYDPLLSQLSGIPIEELPVHVTMEFETITLDKWADRTDPIMKLWYGGMITVEKVLTLLEMEDVIEDLREDNPDRLEEYYQAPAPMTQLLTKDEIAPEGGTQKDKAPTGKDKYDNNPAKQDRSKVPDKTSIKST